MSMNSLSPFCFARRALPVVLAAGAVLALVAVLSGCAGKKDKPKPKPEDESAQTPAEEPTKPSTLMPDPRNTIPPSGEMQQVALIYSVDGRRMFGHLLRYQQPGTAPILILLPDERGYDEWLQLHAEEYARLGYIVLTPDLSDLMGTAIDQPIINNVTAAISEAESQLARKPVGRYAAIGWGPGAEQALTLARHMDLDALVICYGRLITSPEALQKVREPVLGIFGGLDTQVPIAEIQAFQKVMEQMGGHFEGNIWKDEGRDFMRTPIDLNHAREANFEIIGWLDQYFRP